MPRSVAHHCWGWNRMVEMQAWASVYPFHGYNRSEGWCHHTAALAHLHELLSWFPGGCGRGANDSVRGCASRGQHVRRARGPRGLCPCSAPTSSMNQHLKGFLRSTVATCSGREVSSLACRGLVRIQWDYLGENCLYFGMKSSWVLSNLVWREIQGRIHKFKRGLNWWDVHMCSEVTCLKDNWLELSSLLVQMC